MIAFGVDEYSEIAWLVRADQSIDAFCLAGGERIRSWEPPKGKSEAEGVVSARVRVAKVDEQQGSVLLGLETGQIRPVLCNWDVRFHNRSELGKDLLESIDGVGEGGVGDRARLFEGRVYRKTSSGLIRSVELTGVEYFDPIAVHQGAIDRLDWRFRSEVSGFNTNRRGFWAASSGEQLALGEIEKSGGGLGIKPKQVFKDWKIGSISERLPKSEVVSPISGLMIAGQGEILLSIDRDGRVFRWRASEDGTLEYQGSFETLTSRISELTYSEPSLGRSTWLLGNKLGEVEAVTVTATESGQELRSIHRIPSGGVGILSIAASPAERLVAVADRGDRIQLIHTTSERVVGGIGSLGIQDFDRIQFSKSGKELYVCNPSGMKVLRLEGDFPEASWRTFFRPLWYEGYLQPNYVWQSSTGSVEGEPKYSLIPLIFGTLKATLYSMLIAAPIAIFAAIYGSEFMSRKWRSRFKPLIELMASIPSVVLGFLGAMVLAPWLRESLFFVLLSIGLTFYFLLLAAHLWGVIPMQLAIRLRW